MTHATAGRFAGPKPATIIRTPFNALKESAVKRLLVLACVATISVAAAGDWPHSRGPGMDGRTAGAGIFETDALGLELAWKVPLGSSYSGIAVAQGRAVTLFAGKESDWIVTLDAATGEELWRHAIGPVHRGHDGSDDGALSSPTIGDGLVFALSPEGLLTAVRLKDGKPAWSRRLQKEFGAEAPDFGFSTTPLIEGKLLIVQAGGAEGRSIVALDKKNGKTVWTQGDEGARYQSPAAMTLAGKRQIVAVGSDTLQGLDPARGGLLWTHPLGEGVRAGTAYPTFVGEDRFLINTSAGATVFHVSRDAAGGFRVEELYKSDALGQSYAPPVYHDGHIYGFRGQVLSCMDAATGERVWRSRPPGGDGLILVDDQLVIFGSKGRVIVARATPEGYQERASFQALDGSSLTWPSFADGRIFVRNLKDLAAVEVRQAPRVVKKTVPAAEPEHAFASWVERVEAADDRSAMIDRFFADHPQTPLVDGEWIHFVYRGQASDVAVDGSMLKTGNPEPMRRIAGTDFFYRSFRLEPGARWQYRFQLDFDKWIHDERNPRTVPSTQGDEMVSEVITPGYELATHFAPPEGERGRFDKFTLTSKIMGYDKEIQVWLPPQYDAGEGTFPLLIVNDGTSWLDKGLMANTLDNLVGRRIDPLLVAFIPAAGQWWFEAGGSRTDDYLRMQVEELLPALQERYRVEQKAEARGVMGTGFYAVSAVYAALKYPQVFGKAAMQSVYLGLGGADIEQWIGRAEASDSRFYLDWNRYDARNIDRDWDFAEDARTLAGLLRQGGHDFEGGEILDSAGWGGWRNRTDRLLESLFPLKP